MRHSKHHPFGLVSRLDLCACSSGGETWSNELNLPRSRKDWARGGNSSSRAVLFPPQSRALFQATKRHAFQTWVKISKPPPLRTYFSVSFPLNKNVPGRKFFQPESHFTNLDLFSCRNCLLRKRESLGTGKVLESQKIILHYWVDVYLLLQFRFELKW